MDPKARRAALKLLDYNLALVGTRERDVESEERDLNAYLASWFTQCSFDPPLLAIAARNDARSAKMIETSGVFSLNLLAQDQRAVAARFLKELTVAQGTMGELRYARGKTGAPVFPDLPAFIECEVRHAWRGGDHTLFVGEIVDAHALESPPPILHQSATGWQYSR